MLNIGFIGCGNMGSIIAMAVNKCQKECRFFLSDLNHQNANLLSCETGGKVCDNIEIAKSCDFVFLAVKPNIIPSVLKEIAPHLKKDAVVVSMAAGVNSQSIESALDGNAVIRIMPNTPAAVGMGVILYTANGANNDTLELFLELLGRAGSLVNIDEALIDAATAVSGCSPAYAYMFIDAIAKGGAECGVPYKETLKLAALTVKGAAEMVLKSDISPEKLCQNVCSPGGSTIEGVKVLENSGFGDNVNDCIQAAYKRTKELSN